MGIDCHIRQIEDVEMKTQLEWSKERLKVEGVWAHFSGIPYKGKRRYGALAIGNL